MNSTTKITVDTNAESVPQSLGITDDRADQIIDRMKEIGTSEKEPASASTLQKVISEFEGNPQELTYALVMFRDLENSVEHIEELEKEMEDDN